MAAAAAGEGKPGSNGRASRVSRRLGQKYLEEEKEEVAASVFSDCGCLSALPLQEGEVVKVRRGGKGSSTAAGCAAPGGWSTYFGKV